LEAGESKVQGQPRLLKKFKDSLSYRVRPVSKNNKIKINFLSPILRGTPT
jgi:hypothetical protein